MLNKTRFYSFDVVPLQVSITMTFKNGTGGPGDRAGGVWTQPFSQDNCKGNKSSSVLVGF